MWINRRAADNRSRRIVHALHKQVLSQSLRRAELEGAAAQHVRAQDLIGTQLPELQQGLSLWYRSIPRKRVVVARLRGASLAGQCLAGTVGGRQWCSALATVSAAAR